jgi:polar amino acid transport system substrate-binding protein
MNKILILIGVVVLVVVGSFVFLNIGGETEEISGKVVSEESFEGEELEATLKMAMREFPPWRILNEDKTSMTGIDVDIVGEVAKRMGLSLEFVECNTMARCLTLMEEGQLDVLTSLLRTPEREEIMFYMDRPYKLSTPKVFYVQSGSGESLMEYEDLYKFEAIGVVRGAKYFPLFDDDTKLNKYEVSNYEQALEMLSLGRVDAVPGSKSMLDYLVVENEIEGVERASYFFEKDTQSYIAVSRISPAGRKIDKFKEIFNQLMDEGVIDNIKKEAMEKWQTS